MQAFQAPVVRDEPGFLAGQRRLFTNLRKLPVQALAFAPDVEHRVWRSLTLRGFDRSPEVGRAGFVGERRAGRLRVAAADPAERASDPAGHRRIATAAVDVAEAGAVVLPDAASFNDRDQDLHHSVAWMACDYLASRHGVAVLWDLLDAMREARVG